MFPRDPHEPRLITWFRNPRVRRTLILTLLWVFVAAVLYTFAHVLLPFGLAILIAFIIEPTVAWLAGRRPFGRRIPRIAAVVGLYAIFGSFTAFMGSWAVAQMGRELAGVGTLSRTLLAEAKDVSKAVLDRAESFAAENNIPIRREEIEQVVHRNLVGVTEELADNASSLLSLGKNLVGGAFSVIFGSFLVLMLTAFMSMDRARIERFFFSLVPPENQSGYTAIMSGASLGLAGVVRGQVLICLTNGVLTFLGLWILDVKLPLILATVAAVFSLIPIFGSILSTIPIVALALTDGVAKGLFALLWIIGIHLLEANFLNPKIMGDAAKIHPVIVVFALMVGERTAGLIGALFAVPIASVVITVFKFLHRRALEVRPEAPPVPVRGASRIDAVADLQGPPPLAAETAPRRPDGHRKPSLLGALRPVEELPTADLLPIQEHFIEEPSIPAPSIQAPSIEAPSDQPPSELPQGQAVVRDPQPTVERPSSNSGSEKEPRASAPPRLSSPLEQE